MVLVIADGGQSLCISGDSQCHLSERQVIGTRGNAASPTTLCVPRRNKGAHYSPSTLSLPFSLVTTSREGRTAGRGTTPNPFLGRALEQEEHSLLLTSIYIG